jgi:hypothetical protein
MQSVNVTLNRTGVGAHVIHETLATKDVGEEARGILDVRAAVGANHLLPILIIDNAKILSNRGAASHDVASAPTWSDRGQEGRTH